MPRAEPRSSSSNSRAVAVEVLARIESEGAYANLALGAALERAGLDERDRGFTTALVYGALRARRRLDHLADRHLSADPPLDARTALRIGALQLTEMGIAPHAAVGETVAVTPRRYRGLVNAVLRRIAQAGSPVDWPNLGTELSYPDWIVERLVRDLGPERAVAALRTMNEPAEVAARGDGYVQNLASQWVASLVDAADGHLVADVCAAPGGKATAIASCGATVFAADVRGSRLGLVATNRVRLGLESAIKLVRADAVSPPWRDRSFDRVLVDAPCSGLGVLRRRPDARWRVQPGDIERLAGLQEAMLSAAVESVREGGVLVYSVCTLSAAETIGVTAGFEAAVSARGRHLLNRIDSPGGPWEPFGGGSVLLPQTAGTDGMYLSRWRVVSK